VTRDRVPPGSASFRRQASLPHFRPICAIAQPPDSRTVRWHGAGKSVGRGERAMKRKKPLRQTIILTSILLGMSGAVSLASPSSGERGSVIAVIRH
jgi:hypothetical protein